MNVSVTVNVSETRAYFHRGDGRSENKKKLNKHASGLQCHILQKINEEY